MQGTTIADGRIRVFKGIPFGAPPVGELRWQAPRPAAPWQGVRNATEFGPRCLQGHIFGDIFFTNLSEDCLTSTSGRRRAASDRLPVMVWIHGGGFQAGAGGRDPPRRRGVRAQGRRPRHHQLSPRRLRLLLAPELTQESRRNARATTACWTRSRRSRGCRDNIAAFGGDPKQRHDLRRVGGIVCGERADGVAAARRAVPQGDRRERRVFHRGAGPLPLRPLARAEQQGVKFAAGLGAASLAALRAKAADEILKAALKTQPWFAPNLDGYVLTEDVLATFAAGKQAHVPLLAGWNADEVRAGVVLGKQKPTRRASPQTRANASATRPTRC